MVYAWADRIRVNTTTTGTGTINLGAAVAGFRTFAQAVTDGALASGNTVYYAIEDGTNWECGTGVYTAGSPDTLTRVVNSSSAGGTTAISLSGSAQVFITPTQKSMVTIDGATIGATTPSPGTFTTLAATSGTNIGGQSTFSYTTFTDPDVNVPRDAKFGSDGIAVLGGVKTDTLNVTGATTLNGLSFNSGNITGTVSSLVVTNNDASGGFQWNSPALGGSDAPVALTTSAATSASNVLTFASTTGVVVGMTAIPGNSAWGYGGFTVIAVTSTSVTLSGNVSIASGVGVVFLWSVRLSRQSSSDGNDESILDLIEWRSAAGSAWTSASRRMQYIIDNTPMGFVEFNPAGSNLRLALGTGSIASPSYTLTIDQYGYLNIPGSFTTNGDVIAENANNESRLRLKQDSTNGRDYYLISGGAAGAFAGGNFGLYDNTSGNIRWIVYPTGEFYVPGWINSNSVFLGPASGTIWGNQGALVAWNYTNGGGETDFINSRGGGAGGFNFYNVTTSSTATPTLLASIDSTGAFSAAAINASGTLSLTNATSNLINFGTVGVAAPAFTTRSAGTKIVLYSGLSTTASDYAFGISSGTLWSGVPTPSNQFQWFGGTTAVATLSGSGALTTSGDITSDTNLIAGQGTGSASTIINGASGGGRNLFYQTASGNRWVVYTDSTAEDNAYLTTSAAQTAAGTTLTFASTTGVANGMYAYGPSIPAGTTVASFTSTTVTLSTATTAIVGSGVQITFGTNAGSNFNISNYNDASTLVSTPLQITRSSGQVTIGSLNITSALTVNNNPAVTNASFDGGRTYQTGVDINTLDNLYETNFLSMGSATNGPAAATNLGYWFGMGAGDVASRGFELLGTSDSSGSLFFRERSTNTWKQVATLSDGQTFTASQRISGSGVALQFYDATQPTDSKFWDLEQNGGVFNMRAGNDAYTAATPWVSVSRSAMTITNITLAASGITLSTPTATVGNSANTIQLNGANAGYAPSVAGRGSDTNVGLDFDVQGSGVSTFSSHSFGFTEFKVWGNGAADFLGVGSGSGAGVINADGSDTNVSIKLQPKGSSGGVWVQADVNANSMYLYGAGTGYAPSIAARGSDTSVGLGFDVQGANNFVFSSHQYGFVEFEIYGTGAADYLTATSGAGYGQIAAAGSDANVDIHLAPKGTGNVVISSGGVTASTATFGTNYGATTTNLALTISNGATEINFVPSASASAYNSIVQSGDNLIYYTNGSAGTGALVIAPWNASNGGVRFDSSGVATFYQDVHLNTNAYAQNPPNGDSGNKVATTYFVQSSVLGGAGQTWQDVTSSRALNTTYTNSTGRTIFVIASLINTSSNAAVEVTVSGLTQQVAGVSNATAMIGCGMFPVPPGATYAMQTASSAAVSAWFELR